MSVDFKTFLQIVPSILDAKFPVLMRGRHGIGKSTVVYQIAKERGLPVVERRASQMTEGDLLGLPKVEGNVTQWLAPEWLHNACNEPCISSWMRLTVQPLRFAKVSSSCATVARLLATLFILTPLSLPVSTVENTVLSTK